MEPAWCNYAMQKCEFFGNALRCATVSAVICREKRERLLKETKDENVRTRIGDAEGI